MSQRIEYRKFPRGQKCEFESCGSPRYYIEDGRQFCKNGHEQQGFSQVQADEDDFNSQGRKSRLKRAEKEKVETLFSGRDATELFLQCYQLVLWKQVSWLVTSKGLPVELETIVRDLWSVRLRAVKGLGQEGDGSVSAGFSSTSGEETESDTTTTGARLEMSRRFKKAARHNGLPKMFDSLGLCYLGIMLLRLPISLGQMQGWAEREEIVFLRAVSARVL
jgi:RNA polymerase I-specific transcription initiation factor RRN7